MSVSHAVEGKPESVIDWHIRLDIGVDIRLVKGFVIGPVLRIDNPISQNSIYGGGLSVFLKVGWTQKFGSDK